MPSKKPGLFDNPKGKLDNMAKGLENETISSILKSVKAPEGVEVKGRPGYIEITEKRLEKLGVIDMKPYFARSSKKKFAKDGSWYMDIPINLTTRKMTRRAYDELRAVPTEGLSSIGTATQYLYDNRQASSVAELNYQPKSNDVQKKRQGKNRHTYTAFRRVSAKSSPSSWIINRGKVTEENTSKTFVQDVGRMLRWKMRNG